MCNKEHHVASQTSLSEYSFAFLGYYYDYGHLHRVATVYAGLGQFFVLLTVH